MLVSELLAKLETIQKGLPQGIDPTMRIQVMDGGVMTRAVESITHVVTPDLMSGGWGQRHTIDIRGPGCIPGVVTRPSRRLEELRERRRIAEGMLNASLDYGHDDPKIRALLAEIDAEIASERAR